MTVELIAIDSRDVWTAATMTVDTGGPAVNFQPTANVHNAIQWTEEFVAWLLFAWGDAATWDYSANADRSADIAIEGSLAYNWTASSAAQSLLGLDPTGAGSSWDLRSCATLWSQTSPPLAFGAYRRAYEWQASAAGSGASGGSSLGVGVRRPVLEGLTDARGAWRLAELSRAANHPRSVTVWDGITSIDLSLGEATRRRSRPGIYRLSFEVLG